MGQRLGTVVAVGPGAWVKGSSSERIPIPLRVGETVILDQIATRGACPSDEHQARRDVLRESFAKLMDEFKQNDARRFLLGLRGHLRGYSRERDGASRVMDLVEAISALATEEVALILGQPALTDEAQIDPLPEPECDAPECDDPEDNTDD